MAQEQWLPQLCPPNRTRAKRPVGEFRETRHPRNVGVNEICDASFQGQGTHEDLESGIHEVSKSRVCGELDSRTLEVSESRRAIARNLEPARP
jgi:hypothetical protein